MSPFLYSKYINLTSNTSIAISMAFSEPTTLQECRTIIINQTQQLQQEYAGMEDRAIKKDYKQKYQQNYSQYIANYTKFYVKQGLDPTSARQRAQTIVGKNIVSGVKRKNPNGGRPRKQHQQQQPMRNTDSNTAILQIPMRSNVMLPQFFSTQSIPTTSAMVPCNPILTSNDHGNASTNIQNVKVLDKINEKYFTFDTSMESGIRSLQQGYLSNCLKWTNNKCKPHDNQCMKDDCTIPLGEFEGIPCKNVYCIKMIMMEDRENLYHEECLIKYENGKQRYCCWCTILFSITKQRINDKEYFSNYLYPNADWRPKSCFKVPRIESILNSEESSININYAITNCKVFDHYCLLSSKLNDQTAYFLISHRNELKISLFQHQVIQYQCLYDDQHKKQKLLNQRYQIKFAVLKYPFTNVDFERPSEFEEKYIEVRIKCPEYDQSIECGIVQINNLWPRDLQNANAAMAIKELVDIKNKKKQRIRKIYYSIFHKHKWSDKPGRFGMLFNHWNYKQNKSRLQIARSRNKRIPLPQSTQFHVERCKNTFDQYPEYKK